MNAALLAVVQAQPAAAVTAIENSAPDGARATDGASPTDAQLGVVGVGDGTGVGVVGELLEQATPMPAATITPASHKRTTRNGPIDQPLIKGVHRTLPGPLGQAHLMQSATDLKSRL
jgi:hypothetical protein